MGSLTTIILCGLVGTAMYAVLLMFNPFPQFFGSIVPMVDSIAAELHTQLLSNPMITSLLGTISGGAIVNAIRSKMQSQTEKAAQQIQSNMERNVMDKVNQITQLNQEKNQLIKC